MLKTFINDCMRMQKIKRRLKTQAKGVEDFVRTLGAEKFWLKHFNDYLNTRSKLPEIFKDYFELITKKNIETS